MRKKRPAKWFYCTCGCERLVKSRGTSCDSYQPVLFRRINSVIKRTRLGSIYSLSPRFENGVYVPRLKHFGYYCPNCWTYWGATLAEVRKNLKQHRQKKYDEAAALWHLLPELREGSDVAGIQG